MRTNGDRPSTRRSSGRLDVSSSNRSYARKLSDSSGSSRTRSGAHSGSHSSQNSRYGSSSGRYSSRTSYHDRPSSSGSRTSSRYDRLYEDSPFLTSTTHSTRQGTGAFRFVSGAWENFRIPFLIVAGIVVLALALLIAFAVNSGKYVKGTYIGEVDVSGMTVEQAASAVSDYYGPNLDATKVYVFADEKSRDAADLDLQMIEASAQAEQVSFEEAKKNEKLWIASAENLGASLPSEEMAKAAKSLSDSKGFFERIGVLPSDVKSPVYLAFNDGFLDDFMGNINEALGKPVSDYSLEVHDGVVYIDKGHKGNLLDKDEFTGALTQLLLMDKSPTVSYVANLSKVSYDITNKKAKRTKSAIEKLIPEKVEFKCGDASMKVGKSTLMGWISTQKEYGDNGWILKVHFDSDLAAPALTASLNRAADGKLASVSISKKGDDIKVSTNTKLDLYDLDTALSTLEDKIFGTYNSGGKIGKAPENVVIEMAVLSSADEFSLKEALKHGIVTRFSSYTTKYSNTASTANRTNNIHLAAKTLNNSICKANGGVWSFNDVVGPSDAEQGYLEANVIDGNTMTTGVGGGICQVATTVFNAIYEAGLPISERHNHTLYTSSYPAGRDAAIAYPYLDLKWRNDTDSDILVVASFTDYSVTVTLIGVDPGRRVGTETGQWEKGAKYKTTYEVDDDLAKDASYVKQNGSDGMNITVTRTSYDSDGSVLSKDSFPSAYAATDKVIAYGKKSDMDALKEKYEKKPKSSKKPKKKDEETANDDSQQ